MSSGGSASISDCSDDFAAKWRMRRLRTHRARRSIESCRSRVNDGVEVYRRLSTLPAAVREADGSLVGEEKVAMADARRDRGASKFSR